MLRKILRILHLGNFIKISFAKTMFTIFLRTSVVVHISHLKQVQTKTINLQIYLIIIIGRLLVSTANLQSSCRREQVSSMTPDLAPPFRSRYQSYCAIDDFGDVFRICCCWATNLRFSESFAWFI